MKKKDIATTIALTAILFILVVMLGGCVRDLPLEKVTELDTQEQQIEKIQTEPDTVIEICQDTQISEIFVDIEQTEEEKEAIGNHIMDFSVELFQNSIKKEENTLISPFSVMMALSMTANGAKGETLEQIEETFGTSINALNLYFWEYQRKLSQGEDCKFHIANSIWMNNDQNFSVKANFIRRNEDYYYAGIYKTRFTQKTIKDINEWVTKNTDGMITDMIKEIPESTMMYIINALAFDAKWETPYKETNIKEDIFTKETGEEQTVLFMYSTEGGLLEDDTTTGFIKDYKGGKYKFVALLPKEGISINEYIASLSREKITALFEDQRRAIIRASIPKFENTCTFHMKPILEKMGIINAFDSTKADLSDLGTYKDRNTYIDAITHKTYISVTEQGTKAAGVTAVTDNAKSPMMEMNTVELNRPFVYMIMDGEKNVPLFMGTVNDVVKK